LEISLNQKTNRPHNPTVGWENSYATRPHKEQKMDNSEWKTKWEQKSKL